MGIELEVTIFADTWCTGSKTFLLNNQLSANCGDSRLDSANFRSSSMSSSLSKSYSNVSHSKTWVRRAMLPVGVGDEVAMGPISLLKGPSFRYHTTQSYRGSISCHRASTPWFAFQSLVIITRGTVLQMWLGKYWDHPGITPYKFCHQLRGVCIVLPKGRSWCNI